jgi:hypothetical protein
MEKKSGRVVKLVLRINIAIALISWVLSILGLMQLAAISPMLVLTGWTSLLVSVWSVVLALVLLQLADDLYATPDNS